MRLHLQLKRRGNRFTRVSPSHGCGSGRLEEELQMSRRNEQQNAERRVGGVFFFGGRNGGITGWWNFKDFFIVIPIWGRWTHFEKNKLRKWGWFNHQLEGHWLSFCSVDFMKDFASPLEHDCVELSGRRVVRSQNKQVCQVVWRWSNTIDSEVFDDFEEFWHVRYISNAILKNRS